MALATVPNGAEVVVWRWHDGVVIHEDADAGVVLWKPGHGDVVANRRRPKQSYAPGSRAWASSGLPGADWWVEGPASQPMESAEVELDEVQQLSTAHGLWPTALGVV